MRVNQLRFILSLALLAIIAFSCSSPTYQKVEELEGFSFKKDQDLTFVIDIPENGNYEVKYLIRNNLTYPFHNLFLSVKLSDSSKVHYQGLQEVDLFDSVHGKPFGKGLGGTYSHEFVGLKSIQLNKGVYTLSIRQYMREDDLLGLESVGVIVESLP